MNAIKNNVQIVGNLGRNPDVKTFDTGKKVANFVIACNDSYNDLEGRKIENTNWFNVSAWDGLATIAEKYMEKGSRVAINGRLHNKTWTDKEGKKRYSTEIVVTDLLLLSEKKAA